MATKTDTTTTGDAPQSERRPTEPGVGGRATDADAVIKPVKQFDPRRYQAHTMPPGLRTEIVGFELPSMPRDRIADTMPPTGIAEAMGSTVIEPVAESPSAPKNQAFTGSEHPTALEIPRPISRVPTVISAPPKSHVTSEPLPSIIISPVSPKPKPATLPSISIRRASTKVVTEEPQARAIPVRIAFPLAILIFACGVIAVLLFIRNHGGRSDGATRGVEDPVAEPSPVMQPPVATPAPVMTENVQVKALDEPAREEPNAKDSVKAPKNAPSKTARQKVDILKRAPVVLAKPQRAKVTTTPAEVKPKIKNENPE